MSREEQISLPALWCDFNACGLSGVPGDKYYYNMKSDTLAALTSSDRLQAFGYMEDSEKEFSGIAIQLERYRDGWRARPIGDTFVYGNLNDLIHP